MTLSTVLNVNNTVYHETFEEGNFHITMYRIIDCHLKFAPLANYTGAEKNVIEL